MTKVSQADLTAFGVAVKRARSLQGWTLDMLGAKIEPQVGKAFISKIENGRKETMGALTVGRFIKALELDESWIDKFLGADTTEDSGETAAERDADRIFERAQRENVTKGASEDLLIQLANRYADGSYKDRDTAFIAVRTALEAASRISERGDMPPDNTGSQLNAIMAEVAKLNNQGALDEADALLDQEDRRMRELHKAERARQEQQAQALLTQRLDQDRLRNQPKLAAKRLIDNLNQTPHAGGLFLAINAKADEWSERGDATGDIFALRTALQLAKANYNRAKKKQGLAALAHYTLGWCYLRLAERSSNDKLLTIAYNVFKAGLKYTSESKAPQEWAAFQGRLGSTLREMGLRNGNIEFLQSAVMRQRTAVKINTDCRSNNIGLHGNNLGTALLSLGEISREAAPLVEAVSALETSLAQENQGADTLFWEATQNNLALAQRWLGDVTDDLEMLTRARQSYAACETQEYRDKAPFKWARLQWNIADLALARHRLDPDPALLTEARTHVTAARAFFVDGSDHQTQRCDDLLERINQAEA